MNLCFITIKSLKASKRLFKTFKTLTKYEKPTEDLEIQKNREIRKKLVESLKETFPNFEIRKNEERASPERNFRKRSSDLPR